MAPLEVASSFACILGVVKRYARWSGGVKLVERGSRLAACNEEARALQRSAARSDDAWRCSTIRARLREKTAYNGTASHESAQCQPTRSNIPCRAAVAGARRSLEQGVPGLVVCRRGYASAAGPANAATHTAEESASIFRSEETRHMQRKLKMAELDEFQKRVIMWVQGSVKCSDGSVRQYSRNSRIHGDVLGSAYGNVALMVGGAKTGKTSTYLLALADLVNVERYGSDETGPQRDEYRNKTILNRSLKPCRSPAKPDVPKIRGLPKFDWDSLMVPLAIVLVPSREIGSKLFETCCQMNLRARLFAGGLGYKKQSAFTGGHAATGRKKQSDNVDLIVSTPEMLLRVIHGVFEDARIDIRYLRFLVMEEADILCEGFYLEQLNELLNMIHSTELRTLCVTATKTDALMNHILHAHLDGDADGLGRVTIAHPGSHTVAKNVQQVFTAIAQSDPLDRLIETLEELDIRARRDGRQTVVYCNTVKCCKFLEHALRERGYNAASLHGEMGYEQRSRSVKEFGTQSNILVATNVASRGALSCHVDHVISFDFPRNVTDYLHRTAGVAHNGTVNTFFAKKHLPVLKNIQRLNTPEHRIEYRNVSARVARVLQLQLEWDAKLALRNRKLKKGGRKALKLPPRRNILSPVNKKAMKRFYLREKAVKKVQFLQKRGMLRKGYGLPRWPDRAVEASDSQEFVRMQRSADGFLQVIPKRRSRVPRASQEGAYDDDAVPIEGAPSYEQETSEKPRKHHRNIKF